MIQGLSF